jgi:hypothetical protein
MWMPGLKPNWKRFAKAWRKTWLFLNKFKDDSSATKAQRHEEGGKKERYA